jgi:hypothetical protein
MSSSPPPTPSYPDKSVLSCCVCSLSFDDDLELKRHFDFYHFNYARFKCEKCGRILSSKQNLRDHLNIHTGLKPYLCSFAGCLKRFRQGSQLSVHKHIHEAVLEHQNKPYAVEALKLTDCLKDLSALTPRIVFVTVPSYTILPKISQDRHSMKLPSFPTNLP